MKKYEEALRARLENQGVVFDGSNYFEKYATLTLENTNQETEGNNDCGKEEE